MEAYIRFNTKEQEVLITFQQTFWHGVKEVNVFSAPTGQRLFSRMAGVDIKGATPPAPARAREAALRKWLSLLEKAKSKFGE